MPGSSVQFHRFYPLSRAKPLQCFLLPATALLTEPRLTSAMPSLCPSMRCPCYLYVPLHSHAVAMLSINAPAIHSSSTQCPRHAFFSTPSQYRAFQCNAMAEPFRAIPSRFNSVGCISFAVQTCSELSLCSFMQYCALALQSEATALPSFALAHLVIALPLRI